MHEMQRYLHERPVPLVEDSEEHNKRQKLQMQQLLVEREDVGEGRGSTESRACVQGAQAQVKRWTPSIGSLVRWAPPIQCESQLHVELVECVACVLRCVRH